MKKQYYKVINTKNGHHGLYYKLGINIDPSPTPLEQIRSCGAGAIYFTTAENLPSFAGYGDKIAWVTPISKVKVDGNKLKAHRIKITKILPFKDALPLIKEILLTDYEEFEVDVKPELIIKDKKIPVISKLEWLENNDYDKFIIKLFLQNKNDKGLLGIFENYGWSNKDLLELSRAGLGNLIEWDQLRDVDANTMQKIVESNPKKFFKMIVDNI
jgi:hypothetical protein